MRSIGSVTLRGTLALRPLATGTESAFKTYKMRMAVLLCLPEYVRRITGTATPYRTTWYKRRLFSSSTICRVVRL